MERQTPEFKILMVGDSGVGKTCFIKKHLTGEFDRKYSPTSSVEVHPIKFYTNHGPIVFNVWDVAGQNDESMLKEAYFIGSQGGIIMFDVTDRASYKSVPRWHRDIFKICERIPLVLAGNKVEVKERKVQGKQIIYHKRHELQYFDVSAKISYQYEKPFIWLARKVTNWPDLTFVEAPAMPPPEIVYGSEVLLSFSGNHLDIVSEAAEFGVNEE
jgi:GTP-binding nuclear protein Ran